MTMSYRNEAQHSSKQTTVIVPVYNTETYLPACLDSLLRQTCSNFEIIVVDDHSPGDCREIVCRYQEACNRVRYFRHEENRGLLCARLTGVKRSLSEYVAFLDSDDTARPKFLATLVATAEDTTADIVGSARFKREVDEFTIDGSAAIIAALCKRRIPNHNVWTKLFRRTLFEKSPELTSFGEKEHIVSVEDVVITLTLCSIATRFIQIGEILVNYNRVRPGSSWNSIDTNSIMKMAHEIACVFTYIRNMGIDHGECLILRVFDYFYKKRLLHADANTQIQVLDYLRDSPAARDLKIAILKSNEYDLEQMVSRSVRLQHDL